MPIAGVGGGGGGSGVIVIVACTDFVVSVSEVAVMITVPPDGTVEGAVYIVAVELKAAPVMAGLNEPQAFTPQLAVQITPAFATSFVVCALKAVFPLTASELGGTGGPNEMTIGKATIVKLTLLFCEGLLVTLAVMVTVVPIGTTEGAVKSVAAPSAVWTGVSVPHAPLVTLPLTGFPPQVAVQSTPALMLSPVGIMLSVAVVATASEVTFAVPPLELAIKIVPAFAPEPEPLPHPASTMPSTARQTAPHTRLPRNADRFRRSCWLAVSVI